MSAKKLYDERLVKQNKIEKEKVKLNLNKQVINSDKTSKDEVSERENVNYTKKKDNSGEKRKNEEMKEAKKLKLTREQVNMEENSHENNNIVDSKNIPVKELSKNDIVEVKLKVKHILLDQPFTFYEIESSVGVCPL